MEKPVFILIHGYSSSNIWWKYKDVETSKLEKVDFLNKLYKLGDVYEHTMDFFNITYYYTVNDIKERKRMELIYKKYKPHTENIDFSIKDLSYKNICKNIHNNVIELHGQNRKYILVCHSYGSLIGLLYSKIYKKECLFNILIDNPHYYLKLFTQMFNSKDTKKEKKIIDEYLYNNKQLQIMLDKIKNKKSDENVNKEIDMVYNLISYNDWLERIKHYDEILPIYTVIFRATYPNTKDTYKIKYNKWSSTEHKIIKKNNNSSDKFEYIEMPNAEHFIWYNQKYSDDIIDKIKQLIKISY